jgi:hypothetical protein
MKHTGPLALAACSILAAAGARAESLTAEQLERSAFLSLALSQDFKDARLGVRILGQQYPYDDSHCDFVAERLLKDAKLADEQNAMAIDSIAWYVVTLRDFCSRRYREALTIARQRYANPKIVKNLDIALAAQDGDVEQYQEGGVDLVARRNELKGQFAALERPGADVSGIAPGTPLGEVLARAGMPRALSSITLRVGRFGQAEALAAHYAGSALLVFRRDGTPLRWLFVDAFDELYPVDESYQGERFGVAQALASLRGEMFRGYVKDEILTIRGDSTLMWALTHRLSKLPFPSDRFEEDGMLVGLELIKDSRHRESPAMLKEVGAAPGGKIPRTARSYARALARTMPRSDRP